MNARSERHGRTALWWAARLDRVAIARLLVEHGADINIFGDSMGPIHVASKYAGLDMVKFLAAHGAELYALCSNERTVLHCACDGGTPGVVSFLLT